MSHFSGRFVCFEAPAPTVGRIVGLAGEVAAAVDRRAWKRGRSTSTYSLGAEMSETDATLALGYSERGVGLCLKLIRKYWNLIKEHAALEMTRLDESTGARPFQMPNSRSGP